MAGFLITFALATAGFTAEVPTRAAIVEAALEKNVLPHINALKSAAQELPHAVDRVCANGTGGSREQLSSVYRRVVEAYAGVDFLRFGPMLEGGRRERIFYWPDPRGFLDRQLRLILLNKDEAIIKPGAIAKQSVAVQGLSALEVLMTDKDVPLAPGDAAKYRCEFAGAIAANVAVAAGELADGWQKPGGWKDKMLKPGADNDTYKNPGEAASELIKALLTGLALTADLQLKPQVDAKLKLAPPFSKTNLQRAYFEANVASLKQLYEALKLEEFLPSDKDWVRNWSGGAWRAILASDGSGGLVSNMGRENAPAIREVFDRMNGLRKLIIGQMSVAAGLTVGFNELDGD